MSLEQAEIGFIGLGAMGGEARCRCVWLFLATHEDEMGRLYACNTAR